MNLKLILISVFVAFLAFGTGIGIGFILFDSPNPHRFNDQKPIKPPQEEFFYEVPDIIGQLQSPTRKNVFFKLRYVIVFHNESDLEIAAERLPQLFDQNQISLRELKIEDMTGSSGFYLVKEKIFSQAIIVLRPYRPAEILIKELLVQ